MSAGVVLVTGGSRGIGRAIVDALVADGRSVAFTYRSDEKAAREIEAAHGAHARGFALDLQQREAPDLLVRKIESSMGVVDGLVNNAGLRGDSLLAMTSDHDWDEIIEVNLGGTFRCCRAVLPGMIHRRRGAIVNVSSLSAVMGVPGQTAYAASKAAILGLTRSLAREVGKRGLRVNAVLPGFVPTDMTASLPEASVRLLRSHECLPNGTSPADVAGLVAFLVSERAASITGQAFPVDAGTSA
ncbi:MAG TPA: 3-oxoacyl-ACP reductase FabG [Thermoanaerobaculia bacterium]|nr:3-oxoacyl-ACP reductase FabG [Thermoanaerobaculia bacterium]